MLLQPLPPQLLPRHSTVLKSPSPGTGLEGSEELHLEMQQIAVDGFLHTGCTRISKQGEDFLFQAKVGVNPETMMQVTTCQAFSRLSTSRQQRGAIASSTDQSKQFDPGG